jgi:hypothetical protein
VTRKWVDKEDKAGATQRRVVFSSLINYLPDQPIPAAKLLWGEDRVIFFHQSLITGHYNYAAGNRASGFQKYSNWVISNWVSGKGIRESGLSGYPINLSTSYFREATVA